MNISLYLEEGLLLYTLLLLGLTAFSYILFRLRKGSMEWEISRSRMMSCRKCGQVFLQRRQERDKRCPVCGEKSRDFRLPHSVILNKMR